MQKDLHIVSKHAIMRLAVSQGALAQLVGRGNRYFTPNQSNGALAQLVARDIRIVEVRGSTPLCSTTVCPKR